MNHRKPIALLLAVSAALAGCTGDPGTPDDVGATVLRIGQIQTNLKPLLEAAGQLGDLGYTISWSSFPVGPPLIEAEDAGAVDLAYTADTQPILAQAAGVGVHIVAVTRAPAGAQNIALLVGRDSPVRQVSDLRGKRVAIVRGTVTQYLLMAALTEAGLTYGDVTVASLLGPDAIAALQRGKVDAIGLVDPLQAQALVAGARVLRSGVGLLSGSFTFVAADKALADPRRAAAIGDLLRRAKAAIAWAAHDQAGWAGVYTRLYHLPPQAAREAVRRTATQIVPIDGTVYAAQQRQADAFLELGVLGRRVQVGKEYDTRYNDLFFAAHR
jgi:sulfonate transport system substrate-binding protein